MKKKLADAQDECAESKEIEEMSQPPLQKTQWKVDLKDKLLESIQDEHESWN